MINKDSKDIKESQKKMIKEMNNKFELFKNNHLHLSLKIRARQVEEKEENYELRINIIVSYFICLYLMF